ncbi:Uma2 family endonuclease [Chamaesiphon sp. OTE_8_metabat_110]|uniref:Uma2 family endonuclease n=1 Tax=Chamaesiphon sp. OTE_8_metabat_110 TaxID=2964696 RepID=UPI00286B66A1|nr:Uma2 family endonuclease [Chamaesiphon sp. OTE_8_metabat_110]
MQLLDNSPEIQTSTLLDVGGIILHLTHEQFEQLCQNNPDKSLELNKNGELEIVAPIGGESSRAESKLITRLTNWSEQTGLGETFSSSGAFILPNGAERCPDAAWVELSRWSALTPEQRQKFVPLAPDFVIELRSDTDRMPKLREKMEEYRENGVRLGWLIDPQKQQVEIYRLGRDVEILEAPSSLNGEDVLPGFVLDLRSIF